MRLNKLLQIKNKSHFVFGIIIILMSEIVIHIDPLTYEPIRLKVYLFTVIPGIILITSWLLIYKRVRLYKVILFLCIIIFIGGLLRGFIGLGWETSGPFGDIKYYKLILSENNYPHSPSLNHFPPEIPKCATNVKMLYNRAFLQGGKSFSLGMVVDEAEFNNILAKFNINIDKLPKHKRDVKFDDLFVDSDDYNLQSEIKDYWPHMSFRNEKLDILPDDFYFQKTNNKGIAVSLPRREIIYWYSSG